jgi:aquaporin Z
MNKYITELIGTFFLVLVIGLSGNPLAIGSILMVMIYMGGPISGGHYNPAVTLGVLMSGRGKITLKDSVMYWMVQIVGAFLAALLYYILIGNTFAPAHAPGVAIWKALIVEFIFTFALVSVVLNVATTKKAAGNSYFGLAIGFTVLVAAYAGGSISGGAFNPAVGIGPILMDAINGGPIKNIVLYIVGPLLGGVVASFIFRITNQDEYKP